MLSLDGDTLRIGREAVNLRGRSVVVIGAGKATLGLAEFLDALLGRRISRGAVVVMHGQAKSLRYIEVLEAAHPIPDAGSLAAGRYLLEMAHSTDSRDLVLALFTGGSSSLAVAPAVGLSFDDKVIVNQLLLSCGANIREINCVRKHLSAIKGGLLARACACDLVNLSVSDVVGDPPDVFTSPTAPDTTTFADALDVCRRHELLARLPVAARRRLEDANEEDETPKELPQVRTHVVTNARTLCDAAVIRARQLGYESHLTAVDLEGESREAGRRLASELTTYLKKSRSGSRICLVSGGETTVTLGFELAPVPEGGPNQETALAAACCLPRGSEACVLSLDSDGRDGPTVAAGGLVDGTSRDRAAVVGLDLEAALLAHASFEALSRIGDIVMTGMTGTNVNDLRIALGESR
jgi:glycerate 2-kinase